MSYCILEICLAKDPKLQDRKNKAELLWLQKLSSMKEYIYNIKLET
jgi:hypothetical protein